MAYYYASVPGVFPTPDPTTGPPLVAAARLVLEHQLADIRVPAERVDLPDSTRVFRTRADYIERMPKDQYGPVIRFGDARIYWSPTCPIPSGWDSSTLESMWRYL
jgi:hypothetical protein